MIVVMAAGLSANLTANPLKRDHRDGADRHPAGGRPGIRQPKTLAAFALGLRCSS